MKGGRSEARDPPFSARGRPEHSLRNAGWLNYRKAPQAAHWATCDCATILPLECMMFTGGNYVMPPAHFWVGELRNQTSSPLGWGKLRNCPHPSTRVGILRVIRAADTGSTSSAICICVVQEALRRITPKLLRCIRHQLDAAQNFGEAQYILGHMYGRYGQYELGNM